MTDEFIFEIVKKFNASDVVDLEFTRGDAKLVLKKSAACVATTVAVEEAPVVTKTVSVASEEKTVVENKTESAPAKAEAPASEGAEVLKSPIVGTFYRSPSPDSPAYAEKGKKIKKGEPLCILEAMKMMNTMNADFDLEIVDILVKNGELVEFDQPLFSIKKI